MRRSIQRLRQNRPFPLTTVLLVALTALLLCTARADAEWQVSLSLEEGLSLMGGPLTNRLAPPDAITSASVDAITSASRPAHGGGVHLQLRRGGTGALVIGLEYVHYRFDLDYGVGRAGLDIVSLRLLTLARLALIQHAGRPILNFDFGPYLELSLYDRAELVGTQVELELEPVGVGIIIGFQLEPHRFTLANDRGALIPSLFFRGYRGLLTHLRDDRGSTAPLVSAIVGIGLRYELAGHESNDERGRRTGNSQ